MRWKALIVLAALLLSVLSPQSLQTMARDGHMTIGSLDLCHAGTQAVAPQGGMPCIHASLPDHLPPLLLAGEINPRPAFTALLLEQRNEHPPKTS